MAWVYEFEAPNGARLMKRFLSAATFGSDSASWWCNRRRRFVSASEELPDGGSSHSPPIRSFKAFKRFLRRHPELVGGKVVLVSRFVGHNVTARFVSEAA